MLAAESGSAARDLTERLILLGDDVNSADRYGKTPLMYACWAGDLEMIQQEIVEKILAAGGACTEWERKWLADIARSGGDYAAAERQKSLPVLAAATRAAPSWPDDR